jgi:hypothetical protein
MFAVKRGDLYFTHFAPRGDAYEGPTWGDDISDATLFQHERAAQFTVMDINNNYTGRHESFSEVVMVELHAETCVRYSAREA